MTLISATLSDTDLEENLALLSHLPPALLCV